jgi:hypothetical protein
MDLDDSNNPIIDVFESLPLDEFKFENKLKDIYVDISRNRNPTSILFVEVTLRLILSLSSVYLN